MTETDFRSKHSQLIEYYQYIEFDLRSICADLLDDGDRSWFDKLDDFEADPMGKLLVKLKELQNRKHLCLFSADDFDTLNTIRESRNYWVHQCFNGSPHVIFRNNEVRYPQHSIRIINDLNQAIEWDKKITEAGRNIPK